MTLITKIAYLNLTPLDTIKVLLTKSDTLVLTILGSNPTKPHKVFYILAYQNGGQFNCVDIMMRLIYIQSQTTIYSHLPFFKVK